MTASDLVVAIRPVVEALEALGVTFYLTGSVASSAHGIARASLDADIVADLQPAHVQPLIDRLGSAYYIPVDRLRDAVRRRSSCNLIHDAHAPCRRLASSKSISNSLYARAPAGATAY